MGLLDGATSAPPFDPTSSPAPAITPETPPPVDKGEPGWIGAPGDVAGAVQALTQTGFDGAVTFPPATTRVPLPNGRVVATNIYGSAALHPGDLPELKKLGVKTVISFCMPGELGFDEKKMFEDAGFRFVNIAMPDGKVPNSRPDDPHGAVGQFIQAISDPANRPLAIHCAHGEGRTNVFGVLARALELQAQHQPQPFEQAVKEAKHFGFAKLFSGNQVHYARDAWGAIQRGAFGPLPG